MKTLRIIAGLLAFGIVMCGCSRHPKADFSIPTESTEAPETTAQTEAMTFSTQPAEPGFEDADSAYQAYLDAFEAMDVDAYCALFCPDEVEAAGKVPSKFLKNRFDLKMEADYKSFLSRTDPEMFRKIAAADFNTCQNAMVTSGTEGDTWEIIPGQRHTMQDSEVQSFANSLHLDITRGYIRDMFYFAGTESGEMVEGKQVYLLCIDGRWYPSYTKACVPLAISLSDLDSEFSSDSDAESED